MLRQYRRLIRPSSFRRFSSLPPQYDPASIESKWQATWKATPSTPLVLFLISQ